jgi:ABC-2 type transport system permease protein
MKLFKVYQRSMREQIRDWRLLSFSFLCPISFMIVFGLLMGSGYYTLSILVLNQDKGLNIESAEDTALNYGKELVAELKGMRYETGDAIFRIKMVSSEKNVEKVLEKRRYAAFIKIPADFTRVLAGSEPTEALKEGASRLILKGDRSNPFFSFAKMAFDATFNNFVVEKAKFDFPVQLQTIKIGARKRGSEFDYLAPGIMLLAIFMLIIQSAVVLAREIETRTIKRLQVSSVRTWEFLGGVSLTQILFSIVMIPLMLWTAVWVGFRSQGALTDGMIIGVLACISAIAMGLIIAAFSRTGGEAFLIGNIAVIPVVFLSGIFFPVPFIKLFQLGNFKLGLFDLLPTTHAESAFLQIFLYGGGLKDVINEIVWIAALSALYFWIGVLLYRRNHLKVHYRNKQKEV